MGKVFLPIAKVVQKIGRSRSYIYEKIKEGKFPKPYKFDGGSFWLESEIEAWMDKVIEMSAAA